MPRAEQAPPLVPVQVHVDAPTVFRQVDLVALSALLQADFGEIHLRLRRSGCRGRRVRLDLLPAEVGQQGGESPVEAAVHHGKAPNPILAVHLAENQGLLLLIPRTGEDIGRPVQLSFQRQESPGQRLHGAALRRHRHHQPLQEARKAVQVHREHRGLPGLVHGDGALRRTGLVVKNKITGSSDNFPAPSTPKQVTSASLPGRDTVTEIRSCPLPGQVRQFALLSLLQFHGIPSFLAYPFLRPAGLPPYFSGWRPPNQEVDPVFQPSGRRSIRPPQARYASPRSRNSRRTFSASRTSRGVHRASRASMAVRSASG